MRSTLPYIVYFDTIIVGFWGRAARAARLQLSNDISQPRGLVVANMNYLGKPTQGKGLDVVKRRRGISRHDLVISFSRRPIRTAIAPKKPSPHTRSARRAARTRSTATPQVEWSILCD